MKELTIIGPARIHFGLFSNDGGCRFGGMGLMVQEPATIIRCGKSPSLKIVGKQTRLATELLATLFSRFEPLSKGFASVQDLPLEIEIMASPPRHAGFGTGTQISLALTAVVLNAMDIPPPAPTALAAIMNRGRRSAIGSHGFFQGGCLIESGRTENDHVAELDLRIDFPDQWPVVLIRPRNKLGLNGSFEVEAFKKMEQAETTRRTRLVSLCKHVLVPALMTGDFEGFSHTLYDFNRISGDYFSEFQNGPYNGSQCAQIVDAVREFGIRGVGQSSWGPCIFAIASNHDQAGLLIKNLRASCPAVGDESETEILVTCADNVGARITESSRTEQVFSRQVNRTW